jgi:hypothetical protein
MNLARAVELGELREQELQCTLHALVRVLLDPVAAHLHVAGGHTQCLAFWRSASWGRCRGCDLVALRVDDVAPNGYAVDRATVRQSKTG